MNKLTRPITIIALFALFLPFLFNFNAQAEAAYDYSLPNSNSNVSVNSADLLESYLGTSLIDAEYDYLKQFGSVTLTYSDTITSDRVVCEYSSGNLTVKAYSYSYTSLDGTELVWIPESVTVGDRTESLVQSAECYIAVFSSVEEDESLTADVKYTLKITIDSSDISALATQAYVDAPNLKAEINNRLLEYDRLYNVYLTDKANYEKYLSDLAQYELDLVRYLEYLSQKALYDDAMNEYNEYLDELAEYNDALVKQEEYDIALEKYNTAYAEYLVYLGELSDYNAKARIYDEYLKNIEISINHLAIINTAKVKMTLDRDVYSAVMGSLVTEVLVANKDALIAVGAKREVIDAAGEATERLRVLLPKYFSLKTDEEKYSYYSLNFEAFRDNFIKLTQALDELYTNRKIRAEIIAQGRGEKYTILVCQLALISNALNEGPIDSYYGEYKFDSSYKIERKTIKATLDNKTYIKEGIDATPLASGYPREVAKPVAPAVCEEPKAPVPVKVPAKPDKVDAPGTPPTVVIEPEKPSAVTEPTAPVPYIPDATVLALTKAYESGELAQRPPVTENFEYVATTVFKKKLFGVTEITVIFHDTEGNVTQRCTVDKDTPVVYTGALPTKQEDASATYSFAAWQDGEGREYDLLSIPSDLLLYPKFTSHTKYYNVTFEIDGVKTTASYPYGAMPAFDGVPAKSDNGGIMYTFKSWDKAFSAVVADVTYRAEFDSSYIIPIGNGGADITRKNGFYIADCLAASSTEIDIEGLIARACAANCGIVLKTRFASLTLSYSTLVSMHGSGDSVVSVSVVQKGVYGYSYRIDVKDKGGQVTEASYKITASVPCKLPDTPNNSLFFTDANGERSFVNYTLSDGRLEFKPTAGMEYTLLAEYAVNVIYSEYADIKASHAVAHNGDSVELVVNTKPGYRLIRVRILDSLGNEVKWNDGIFSMPSSDVTVVAECEPIKYTVTFMDGDKTIATYTYGYGEQIVPPKTPVRAGDARHKYTFIGWSDELLPVTENVTYYAMYKTTLLPAPQEPEGLQISASVMRLIVAFIVAVFMLTAVVLPSVIIATVLFFVERKKLVKKIK